METINNVASAAAKAVWGDSEASKEPVSGVKGDVSKGEPYDAGNLDTPSQEKVEMRLDSGGNTDGPPSSDKPTATASAPPKGDTSGGQNDTRHPDDVPDTLDPDTLTGPGPKPVEVVAKQHGGDAGQAKKPSSDPSSPPGPSSGGDSKVQEENKEDAANAGTGDAYMKTTGFSADGGDFDAKNPGAGREADRLVHQKHSNDETTETTTATTATTAQSPSQTDAANGNSSPSSKHSKNKPSLSERIKAKLHRH